MLLQRIFIVLYISIVLPIGTQGIGAEVDSSKVTVDPHFQTVSYEAPASKSDARSLVFTPSSDKNAPINSTLADESLLIWKTEIESTFLRPSIDGNSQGEMDYRLFEAPRISLETTVGNYQFSTSFWYMQADESATSYYLAPYSTSNSSTYNTYYVGNYNSSSASTVRTIVDYGELYHHNVFFDEARNEDIFEAYTLDLEASRSINLQSSEHKISFGIRNAQLSNAFYFEGLGSIIGRTYNRTRVKTSGIGLTTGISGKVPIRKGMNASLFYRLRGSVLWGNNDTRTAGVFGEELIPGALNRSINGRTSSTTLEHNDTESTFIGEAQIGIDIDYNLFGSPSGAFLRAMFEYQNWMTDIEAYENVGWTAPNWSIVDVDDADILSLVGFSVSTGYEW